MMISLPLARAACLLAVAVVVATVPATELAAQRKYAAVTGFVTDTNGIAVPRVEVAILGSTQHRVFTDSAGRFRFSEIGPGEHIIMARRFGFVARSFVVQLQPADTAQLVLELVALAVELPEMVVNSTRLPSRFDEVRHRQAMGMGNYITREQIDLKKPRRTSDLLRTQLGVQIGEDLGRATLFSTRGIMITLSATGAREGGQVTSGAIEDTNTVGEGARRVGTQTLQNETTRCRIPIILDSQLMSEGFSLDDILPEEVETIEVYRGLSTIPAAFLRYETRCGLVIVWTRAGELRKSRPSSRRE